MIAHRLSTVVDARIIVLEHGTIVERGPHAELLARAAATRRCGHCSRAAPRTPSWRRKEAEMDTKWLEDFVSLAETRSFSRSAQLRHVTQPAFSRRIQSLEAWAGTDLVDRQLPTRLTPAGQTLYEQALEILHALQTARGMLRHQSPAGQDTVEFAVPHAGLQLLSGLAVGPARDGRPGQDAVDRAQRA